MGCGCSGREKEAGLHGQLETHVGKLGVEAIDAIFEVMEPIMEAIEDIRSVCIDKRDHLVYKTGAFCHKQPSFKNCLLPLLWRISADHDGNILNSKISFTFGEPFLVVTPNTDTEIESLVQDFVEYFKAVIMLPEKLAELAIQIAEKVIEVTDKAENMLDDLQKKLMGDPFGIPKAIKNFWNNIGRVKDAGMIVPELTTELTQTIEDIKSMASLITDVEHLKTINEIGAKAKKNGWTGHVIAWNGFKPEERAIFPDHNKALEAWQAKLARKEQTRKEIEADKAECKKKK